MLLTRPLVFFGGKGGVGKTTMASAYALLLAEHGHRTLLVSTDPAHSTGDLLGAWLSGEPSPVTGRLAAVEVDAEAAAAAHVARIKEDAAASFDRELQPAIERHLDLAAASPGTVETALFDEVVRFMDHCPDHYDRVVFDTAPTGHTLRLLTLPALLTAWVEGLVRQREKVAGTERMLRNLAGRDDPDGDPVMARLRARRDRFLRARRRLLEDAVFHLVLTPERLPIEESARALTALDTAGVRVGALVLNRLLPDTADGDFLRARREAQDGYRAEIAARFPGLDLVRVEQQPHDVHGLGQLRSLTAALSVLPDVEQV